MYAVMHDIKRVKLHVGSWVKKVLAIQRFANHCYRAINGYELQIQTNNNTK